MDFKGKKRCNDTHAFTTDPDARLYRKSKNTSAQLCHLGHVLMENRRSRRSRGQSGTKRRAALSSRFD